MSTQKIPVFLLTGFLGSGKTTLLNAALRTPALANTAVVVNELGEVGIDNLIISQAIDNVVLLDAGCLCCANTGALHETLADLAARRASGALPRFERVIIETSGVVDPAPLLNVLLGHPLVTGQYALEATVCVVDAQHFLASRLKYPELDRQAAVAERIVLSKTDVADPAPVIAFLEELNCGAELFLQSPAIGAFFPCETKRRVGVAFQALGPIRPRGHASGIRAHLFRPPAGVTWAGWSAWSRLVAGEFGDRLIRIKGLLHMDDTGEVVLVQGVQGVFHAAERFRDWPDADHANRLVCIARDLDAAEIAYTLPALNTEAGTQARYCMQDLRKLHDEQQRQEQP
jgi:G3E family GTPase